MEQTEVTEMEHEPGRQNTELIDNAVPNDGIQVQPQIRKSTRTRKPSITSDFLCYLQETEYNIGDIDDPMTYSQAVKSSQSDLWRNMAITVFFCRLLIYCLLFVNNIQLV